MQKMSMSASPPAVNPLTIFGPPDGMPAVLPVNARGHLLPFAALSWENFEPLFHPLKRRNGCDEMQGNLFSRALSGAEFEAIPRDGRCIRLDTGSEFTGSD